jgi:predicted ATPase
VSHYDHLLPELQAFADLPADERIQLIGVDRWISHPVAADLLTYPQRNRMPGLLIHGRTGMGKTMILKKFCRDLGTATCVADRIRAPIRQRRVRASSL